MHDDTAQLLASIESTVQGLIFRSEDTYALKPLVWDVSTQGEFDISRLLKSTGNLIPIELDDFLSWQEYLEDFDRWHDFLEQNPEYKTLDLDDFLDRQDQNQGHTATDENNDCEHPDYLDIDLSARCDFVRHRAEEYEVFLSKSVIASQRYRSLLDILETCITQLQVYRVVKYDDAIPCRDEDEIREFYLDNDFTNDEIAEYEARMEEENLRAEDYSNDRRSGKEVFESIKILVGKISDDCWIGISPICSNIEFPNQPSLEKFLAQQIENTETVAIESKLKPILDTLTFITRNFYDDFQKENCYICEFAKTESEVINRLLHLSNFLNTWEFKGIGYARTGYFEIDEASKFDRIDELLTSHLKNLRVHVVGTTSMFDLYAIGQAESGDCLGVSTTAIWTG